MFTFLDKQGFIQNDMGIPIFYQIPREYSKKRIHFNPQVINNLIYNTDIPKQDIPNTAKKKKSNGGRKTTSKTNHNINKKNHLYTI